VSITEERLGPPAPLQRAMAAEVHDSVSPGRQAVGVTVRVGYEFAG
jgi:uncharacterized protein YggE